MTGMDEATIRRIVDLCVREIRKLPPREPGGACESERPCDARPKLLAVFTGGMKGAEAALTELEGLRKNYRITGAASASAIRMFGKDRLAAAADEWIDGTENPAEACGVDGFDAVVFPTLSQNTAAKAAWGIRDGFACELMASALLAGRRVVAARDSVCPGRAGGAYAGMLRTILERLVAFGVGLCDANDLGAAVRGCSAPASAPVSPEPPRKTAAKGKKTVITASVVQDAARAGKTEITLDAAAILTPLARDEARERGIRFIRSGEK